MRTLNETLMAHAETIGDKVAVQTKKESLTYRDIATFTGILSGYFSTIGIKKGDYVILEAISEPVYILSYLALRQIGAVTAPVERGLKAEKLEYMLNLLDARLYLSVKDARFDNTVISKFYKDVLEDAKSWALKVPAIKQDGDENAEVIFTSGTTGQPKAALHSVNGICCNTINTVEGIEMLPDDKILLPLPLNHSFGMRVLRSALEIGATVVLQSGAVFADSITENIKKYDCNAFVCVSATMESVIRQIGDEKVREEFSGLRYIEFSAGAVPKKMREKLITLLPNTQIHNTWGSSETGGCLFLNVQRDPDKVDAVGKAPEHIALGIYSDDTDSMSKGFGKDNVGRLAIKGDMVFKGYHKQEEKYKESIKDGWYVTNDLVWRDSDGYYYILGRADNMINCGGEKIAPSEIENAVFGFEGIKECACIGIPDEKGILGEIPMFLYSLSGDISPDEEAIKKHISSKIGIQKTPDTFLEVPVIPKNYMKKTDYKKLKKIYENEGAGGLLKLSDEEEEKGSKEQRKYDLGNDVIKTILSRKSQRSFTDEQVPQEVIRTLVDAAKCAPSGKNLQTRQFTVISDQDEIYNFKSLVKRVAEEKKTSFNGFENPPLLILISNDRRNKDGIQDVGVSAQNIMIAAESLGLGSVWLNPLMEISDEDDIRKRLTKYNIPDNHIVWAVMAIGHPAGAPPEFERKQNAVHFIA